MNRNSRNNQQLAPGARTSPRLKPPAARWRWFLAALLLALVTISADLLPSARAAADQGSVSFEVWAFPAPKQPQVLCVNAKQPFYVSVHKNIHKDINNLGVDFPAGAVSFLNLTGTVQPSNIGVLNHNQDSSELAGLSEGEAGSANFEFIAKKPGTATLTFTANVSGHETGSTDASVSGRSYSAKKAEITVKVIHCKFKAKTVVKFPPNGKENPLVLTPPIVARMEDAELVADAGGHFTGSGSLQWFGGTQVSSFGGGSAIVVEKFSSTSPVELAGEMSDDGLFTLNLAYDMVFSSFTETINGASASGQNPYLLDPMQIIAPDSGVNLSQPQGYNASSFMGSVIIEVTPEDDTASAFNPSDQAASSLALSPWAAVLWSAFPRWVGSGGN